MLSQALMPPHTVMLMLALMMPLLPASHAGSSRHLQQPNASTVAGPVPLMCAAGGFCSVGAVTPASGDIHLPGTLAKVLAAVAYKKEVMAIAVGDEGRGTGVLEE